MALPRAVCRVAEPTARAVADSLGVPLDQYLAYARTPCLASPRAAPAWERVAPVRFSIEAPAVFSSMYMYSGFRNHSPDSSMCGSV